MCVIRGNFPCFFDLQLPGNFLLAQSEACGSGMVFIFIRGARLSVRYPRQSRRQAEHSAEVRVELQSNPGYNAEARVEPESNPGHNAEAQVEPQPNPGHNAKAQVEPRRTQDTTGRATAEPRIQH